MAYGVEQDRLRALLPDGFSSLRPVLRINAEIRDGKTGYVEFNTAAEKNGVRGWLNIAFWNDVPFEQDGKTTRFLTDIFWISALPASGSRAAAQQKRTTQAAFSFIPRRNCARPSRSR